jgi:hypothetical protein
MQLIENIVLGCLMCPNWSSIPVFMINHDANIQNSVTGGSDKSIVSMKVRLRLLAGFGFLSRTRSSCSALRLVSISISILEHNPTKFNSKLRLKTFLTHLKLQRKNELTKSENIYEWIQATIKLHGESNYTLSTLISFIWIARNKRDSKSFRSQHKPSVVLSNLKTFTFRDEQLNPVNIWQWMGIIKAPSSDIIVDLQIGSHVKIIIDNSSRMMSI